MCKWKPQHKLRWQEVQQIVFPSSYRQQVLKLAHEIFHAKELIHSLHTTLSSVGFEIRQWASNDTKVICERPHEARSGANRNLVITPSFSRSLRVYTRPPLELPYRQPQIQAQSHWTYHPNYASSAILSAISFLTQQEPKLLSSIYGVTYWTGMILIS